MTIKYELMAQLVVTIQSQCLILKSYCNLGTVTYFPYVHTEKHLVKYNLKILPNLIVLCIV